MFEKEEFWQNRFIAADHDYEESDIVIVGLPFDGTASFRPGSRFGPNAIREASWGIETYSARLKRDLRDLRIADLGDLEIPFGNAVQALRKIGPVIRRVIKDRKFPVVLGGEHLVSLPVVEELHRSFSDLIVICLDAHTDLRDEYMGETHSHATVARRILDVVGEGHLFQVGVRSGTREEFEIQGVERVSLPGGETLSQFEGLLSNRPVYVACDLDVFDPSILPGTSAPEPGGLTFDQVTSFMTQLSRFQVVGFDVVELTPHYDQSRVSAITASVLVREMILQFCQS